MVLAKADSTESSKLQTDSYPFSVESSFRELDDVFLQTQTRIWLGEVLKTRLDEEMSIADLLADGILLFEVSNELWKMLLTKFMKLRSSKAYFSRSASGKNRGRYMPYSNVDAFLKICQILGLTGIDLFSASDVVEKRETRRVCMCIRSLSKKAISKDLNVPDFDIVTYTVAMPTDMVKGIRNSLEKSKCRFSEDSASCSTQFVSRRKYGQKNVGVGTAREYDSSSEDSDNTDNNFQVVGCDSPDFTTCSGVSLLNSDLENSQRGSSLVLENFDLTQCMFQTDGMNEATDVHSSDLCSPSPEAKGSLNTDHLLDNHQYKDTVSSSRLSLMGSDYSVEQHTGAFCGNNGTAGDVLNKPRDETKVSPVNLELESCNSFEGSSMDHHDSERNIIGHSSSSVLNGCSTHSDESSVFNAHEKDVLLDLYRGANSVYNTSIFRHGKKSFEEIEDADVFNTALSNFGKAKTIDYEDRFEENDAFSKPDMRLREHQNRVENHITVDRSILNSDQLQCHLISNECKDPEASEFVTPPSLSGTSICQSPITVPRDDANNGYSYSVIEDLNVSGSNMKGPKEDASENLRHLSLSGDYSDKHIDSTSEAINTAAPMLATEDEHCNDHNMYLSSNGDDWIWRQRGGLVLETCIQASKNYPSMPACSENDGRKDYVLDENDFRLSQQACTNHKEEDASFTQCLDKEKMKNEQVERDIGASNHKRRRKRLVKSVAGGISVVAVFLLLFHLRRPNGREKINGTSVHPLQSINSNKGEVSKKPGRQNGSTHGVYPAGKLRF